MIAIILSEEFLSTPSARRATGLDDAGTLYAGISIHALREEGDQRCRRLSAAWRISIHALREEGDLFSGPVMLLPYQFLSTPSARRATNVFLRRDIPSKISIHALREEGDVRKEPCQMASTKFLSTPSARRATHDLPRHLPAVPISIHALREEGDCRPRCGTPPRAYPSSISIHALREEGDRRPQEPRSGPRYFYPRPPRGGRQEHSIAYRVTKEISIHALREEGDRFRSWALASRSNFYPRPPRGGRPGL